MEDIEKRKMKIMGKRKENMERQRNRRKKSQM